MEIVEQLDEWTATFEQGWPAHLRETGQADFKQYVRPRNRQVPPGSAGDLAPSRLLLISSAGGYLAATMASWNPGGTRLVNPPRAAVNELPRGSTLGTPQDEAQQRRILDATLALLVQPAPVALVKLDEGWTGPDVA